MVMRATSRFAFQKNRRALLFQHLAPSRRSKVPAWMNYSPQRKSSSSFKGGNGFGAHPRLFNTLIPVPTLALEQDRSGFVHPSGATVNLENRFNSVRSDTPITRDLKMTCDAYH